MRWRNWQRFAGVAGVLGTVWILQLWNGLGLASLIYWANCELIGSYLIGLGVDDIDTKCENGSVEISCCDEFCRVPFDWNKRMSLISTHAGKHLVTEGIVRKLHVVLKGGTSAPLYRSLPEDSANQNVSCHRLVYDWTVFNYGSHVPESFLVQLSRFSPADLQRHFLLLQQDEFFYMNLLPHLNVNPSHFPKLLGVCGNYYVVEFVDQIFSDWFILNHTWAEMVPVIRGFVSLAAHLKNISLELCDVKLENFGWDEEQQVVKLVDLDNVFFTDLLEGQLEGRNCESDVDCDIFDCLGKCDIATQKCDAAVVDGNFARFCRDLFKPGFIQKGLFSAVSLGKKREFYAFADLCGISSLKRSEWMTSTLLDMLLAE